MPVGFKHTLESKKKIALAKISANNPNWKGSKVGYSGVHDWVRYRMPDPHVCERCKEWNIRLDLANKSQKYLRDLTDWEWLCRKCHMEMDKKVFKITIDGIDHTGLISDGYHTFDELYEHRFRLFIALCETLVIFDGRFPQVWRSKLHADGTMYDGMFILGLGKEPGKQITYHLNLDRWDETDFAETLVRAPEWDGHTPGDVLERLKAL